MAGNAVLLKDVIRVNPRFQRSVHLEKDYQTRGQDQDYHITPTAMDICAVWQPVLRLMPRSVPGH